MVGILCLNSRHDYPKFLDIARYQWSTEKSLPWLICVSMRNSKRVSEDTCFAWQSFWSLSRKYLISKNNWSVLNLGMIGLTIIRVISRNKKNVVIVLKIHKYVARSMVLEFMIIVFKSGIVLYGMVFCNS